MVQPPFNRTAMTNRSRSRSHIHFHSYGIICPVLLLLLLLAAPPSATAQMSPDSSSEDIAYSNFSPSVAILIVVLIGAFFLMGFLSLYIRHWGDDSAEAGNSRPFAAARLRQRKCGLDDEVINSFPIFQYSEVKDLKIGKGGTLECAVCLAEFENDDTLRLLPKCDHVFHSECIDAWLASHITCPVCRANLTQSQNQLVEGTESTHSSNPVGLGEAQNQIQISIDIDGSPNREAQVSEVPKRSPWGEGRFPRSHSTGHSLFQPGENFERYTLRLPVEVRRQMMSQRLKRTISCVVVLPVEGSSRRGEGSSRWRPLGRSDRWVFSMTPPFFSRARLLTSLKMGVEGDVTAVESKRWTRHPV